MLLMSHNLGSLSLRWDYLHAFKFPWISLVSKKFGPERKRGMKGGGGEKLAGGGATLEMFLRQAHCPHHVKVVNPFGGTFFLYAVS